MVDPRGLRFGAGITFFVLVAALLIGPRFGWIPLTIQTVAFAMGSLAGPKFQPYSLFFRKLVQPRLGPPAEFEDASPPRFAQTVGLVFALLALAGSVFGVNWLFYLGAGFALAASYLNWAFDFCLGCEMYLLVRKVRLLDGDGELDGLRPVSN